MKKQSYFQGTEDPKKKYKPDELPTKRIDLDTRHPHVYTWYTNHDYRPDVDPYETSIGGGLYHGPMDRFKSVKEFLDRRKKKMKERRDKASGIRMNFLVKLVEEHGDVDLSE